MHRLLVSKKQRRTEPCQAVSRSAWVVAQSRHKSKVSWEWSKRPGIFQQRAFINCIASNWQKVFVALSLVPFWSNVQQVLSASWPAHCEESSRWSSLWWRCPWRRRSRYERYLALNEPGSWPFRILTGCGSHYLPSASKLAAEMERAGKGGRVRYWHLRWLR